MAESPSLAAKDYFDIPRGRVLFAEAMGHYRICSSRAVCGDAAKVAAVRRRFRVSAGATDAVPDAHYELEPDGDD